MARWHWQMPEDPCLPIGSVEQHPTNMLFTNAVRLGVLPHGKNLKNVSYMSSLREFRYYQNAFSRLLFKHFAEWKIYVIKIRNVDLQTLLLFNQLTY